MHLFSPRPSGCFLNEEDEEPFPPEFLSNGTGARDVCAWSTPCAGHRGPAFHRWTPDWPGDWNWGAGGRKQEVRTTSRNPTVKGSKAFRAVSSPPRAGVKPERPGGAIRVPEAPQLLPSAGVPACVLISRFSPPSTLHAAGCDPPALALRRCPRGLDVGEVPAPGKQVLG